MPLVREDDLDCARRSRAMGPVVALCVLQVHSNRLQNRYNPWKLRLQTLHSPDSSSEVARVSTLLTNWTARLGAQFTVSNGKADCVDEIAPHYSIYSLFKKQTNDSSTVERLEIGSEDLYLPAVCSKLRPRPLRRNTESLSVAGFGTLNELIVPGLWILACSRCPRCSKTRASNRRTPRNGYWTPSLRVHAQPIKKQPCHDLNACTSIRSGERRAARGDLDPPTL